MDDLGTNPAENDETESQVANELVKLEEIPFKFFDKHEDMELLIFKPFIEYERVLPRTGFNLVTFNAHIDKLVPDDMQLRLLVTPPSERHLFDDFGMEKWLKNAAKKGYVKNIVWIKPPWTQGVLDGSRILQVPDSESNGIHEVSLDMKTLCRSVFEDVQEDYEGFKNMFSKLSKDPYILDIGFSFFSCDHPFTQAFKECPTYYPLFKQLFKIQQPISMDSEHIKEAYNIRDKNLKEIESICVYLQENRSMPPVEGEPTFNFKQLSEIRKELLKYYEDSQINWCNIYAAGLVCNEYQMPIHFTEKDDIVKMVDDCVSKVLDLLPTPPTIITVVDQSKYGYLCPEKNLIHIMELLRDFIPSKYENVEKEDYVFD